MKYLKKKRKKEWRVDQLYDRGFRSANHPSNFSESGRYVQKLILRPEKKRERKKRGRRVFPRFAHNLKHSIGAEYSLCVFRTSAVKSVLFIFFLDSKVNWNKITFIFSLNRKGRWSTTDDFTTSLWSGLLSFHCDSRARYNVAEPFLSRSNTWPFMSPWNPSAHLAIVFEQWGHPPRDAVLTPAVYNP